MPGLQGFHLRQQLLSLYSQQFGPVRKDVQSKRVPAALCVITWLWSPTKVATGKEKKKFLALPGQLPFGKTT